MTELAQPGMFAVFKNRNFNLLFISDFVSDFGSGITSIAASILVYRETGSALSVGLMLMATALPGLFFGLIAGVFVDRWDRKRIMIASELLRTVLTLAIPFLIPYGIWWLYLIVMINSTIDQFFEPAHASTLPDVTTDEELAAANSFLSVSMTAALGLGFAVAGILMANFSVEWAFFIDAMTFLVSGLAISLVRLPKPTVAGETSLKAVVDNLRAGFGFLANSPILRSLLWITIPMALLFGLHNSLLLPFAERALDANEGQYGLMEGLAMVGFVLGGFWMVRAADRLREGQWLALSFLGMGLLTIVYSQLVSVKIAILLGILAAFTNVPSYIARKLVIQRHTTREVRGRVSSVFFVTRDTLFVVGMGMAALADFIDVRVLIAAEGVLLALLGVVVMILPGLGRPAAEWRRAISLLRGVGQAPGLGVGRSATLADLDLLAASLPAFAHLPLAQRQRLIIDMRYIEGRAGSVVVKHHDLSDAAYFILAGRAVAGREENGEERVLEVLSAGDFFGEIAALTGVPRTANVVIDEPARLLKVPSKTLQEMAKQPELQQLFTTKMNERLVRMNMMDIPRMVAPDQELMRDLRTPATAA